MPPHHPPHHVGKEHSLQSIHLQIITRGRTATKTTNTIRMASVQVPASPTVHTDRQMAGSHFRARHSTEAEVLAAVVALVVPRARPDMGWMNLAIP